MGSGSEVQMWVSDAACNQVRPNGPDTLDIFLLLIDLLLPAAPVVGVLSVLG